jgi:hypothetical protein
MANNSLAVSQLDYVGITDSLVSFLHNYPQLKDYDFEGSNLRTLIDLLGYNTYLNSFYTNMAINEMFLDTAVIRDSIVSHAKELNYIPRSARSAEALIDIVIYPTDAPSYITIPKGSSFQGTNGNSVFTFLTASDTIISPVNGTYSASQVPIYEGVPVTENFVVNTSIQDQRYILSNPNIDTTSLSVMVTNSSGSSETWDYHETLLGITTTSKAWFLQATSDKYEVVFGDGVAGLAPPNGATITASYRVCNQDQPNGIYRFKSVSSLGGYSNFVVSTSTDSTGTSIKAQGGQPAETNASIRFNAPRAYQTLQRAVTSDDYKTILFTQYPEIRAIHVYGGDEVSPPQYGKVFIAVDVLNAVGLSELEMNKIQSFISTKAPISITPIVTQADYTFVKVDSNVKYDMNTSSLSASDVQTLVLNAISAYNTSSLVDFNVKFRYSKLVAAIDNALSAITDNETSVMIFKKAEPTLNTNYSAALKYQNQLVPGTISSSAFTYDGVSCFFSDDGKGNLQISSTTNGVASVLAMIGTIDYTNGIVNIVNLNVSDYVGNAINIYSDTVSHDFSAAQNVILEIDADNTTVTVTGIRA